MQENFTESYPPATTPRWVGMAVAGLAVVSTAALGFGWTASSRAQEAQESLAAQAESLQESREVLSQRLTQAEGVNARLQADLNVVTDRLKLTQNELARARKQTQQLSHGFAKDIEEMDTAVRSELARKAGTEEVSQRMGALSGELGGVRGDLDSTRRDLALARSEFGTLIARNHEEVEQLRRLGERDYLEFTLARKGARQKLGAVVVELRGVNPKKSLFTVALYVDDKRLEKKNRAANEPIFFYTRGARKPYELVINEVQKDKIVGYLSIPRGASSPTGGK